MIALAEKAGKLDELTQSIDQIELPEDKSSDKFRDAMALKTLLAIANEDDQTARSHLGEIYASVVAVEKKAKENKVDPFSNHSSNFNQRSEINRTSIAVPTWYATNRPALLDCATSLHTKCKWGLKNRILARIENRSFTSTNETKSLTQWHSMPRSTQSGNQSERYLDRWQMTSTGLLEHLPGVTNTPLYFQSPLQGKFEITADVTLQTGTQCWLDYGGYAIIPQEKHHQTRIADGSNSSVEEKKKVPRLHSVAQYRIVVDGNDIEIYVNDVRVSRHEFDEAPQPWFSLEANNSDARPILQNIRITGQPEIPQEIDLLAADRPQWRGSFERFKKDSQNQSRHYSHRTRAQMQQQILNANAKWVLKKGELTSGSLTEESSEAPIFEESWLLYRRPMLEDGEFEFEMLADEKEKKLCHVALGRTAMLLKEDGIWRHKIYGGEDLEEEVADERIAGSKGVKLKNGDWNRVLIRLTGDEATLAVNDQEVAVLPITEIASQRFPGLFRFSDQSNAQVRNIKYRGKWPISLPTLEQQELALTSADPLAGVVVGQSKTYDLSQSIDQLNTAGLEVKGETQIETTADGMKITARKNADSANWPTVSATVDSAKDFDVSVSFADLKIANVTGWGCNLDLQVDFDDVEKSAITVGMRRDKDNALFVLAQREYDQPDGERGYHWVQLFKPLEQGTLRLVRHNGKIYALAAANGKPHQVINSFTVGQKAVSAISVIVKSATDTAEFDGVVKQVSLTLAD